MAATITVICPHCNNHMRASAEFIGRKGRCPTCKSLVEIAPTGGEAVRTLQPTVAGSFTERRRRERTSTEVTAWLPGLIGVAATVILYVAIFIPVRGTYLGNLFLERGPIQYAITLVTCWGLAMLAMKWLAVRREQATAELELELIPLEIGLQVTPGNVDQFVDHLARLPAAQREGVLGRRLRGALEHFKHRNSVPEVQEYLASQAEIDASGVDSGYTLLRAFIWCVPILGFIGTVTGIGSAVGGLSNALASTQAQAPAGDPDADAADGQQPAAADPNAQNGLAAAMMAGMNTVVDGLATAFDTTLVGLVAAIMLLFPTESLRKNEYAMLDRIEEFTNESLLRRMLEKEKFADQAEGIVRDALEAAFKEHQRWLVQWQAQVSELGQVIGAEFESAFVEMQDRLSDVEKQRLQRSVEFESQRMQRVENTAKTVEQIFGRLGTTGAAWEDSVRAAGERLVESLHASENLSQSVERNKQLLSELAAQVHAEQSAALAGITLVPTNPTQHVAGTGDAAAAGHYASPDGRARGGFLNRLLGRKSRDA